jgi:ubiquinone/menaquinone biosynthesis C-methylase UbiE
VEKVFKYSKSEKRGLKLLNSNMEKILSIGISTGGSAEIAMAKKCPNAKIIATTIDEKGLAFSVEKLSNFKEFNQIDVRIEDVSKSMPYEDNNFDFIYARLVLHYLTKQQLEKVLKEIHRTLKPNGILFIVARNNKEWEIAKKEYIIEYDEETNMTTYYVQGRKEETAKRQCLSEEQLESLINKYNLKIKRIKSYKEKLYTDYERTRKNRSKKANYLTEVVAFK